MWMKRDMLSIMDLESLLLVLEEEQGMEDEELIVLLMVELAGPLMALLPRQ